MKDENNLPIPPEEQTKSVWIESADSAMSIDESNQSKAVLKIFAKMIEGTDFDGQTITISHEGEDNDAFVVDGKILYLDLLSVEKVQGGIGVTVEASEKGEGQSTRFHGILTEEGS